MPSLPKKECAYGDLQVQAFACFVTVGKRTEIICSLAAVSVGAYGGVFWMIVWLFDPPVEWELVESWCAANVQGRSLKTNLCRLCLGATVYHLWRHRNDLLHGNTPRSEEGLVAQIRWEVRSKILAKYSVKKFANSITLVHRWIWSLCCGCSFGLLFFSCFGL